MSNITDLEKRINSAESTLEMLRGELEELKQQEQPESLLGRWATHPEYGRGIIGSDKPNDDKEVRFIFYCDNSVDGVKWEYPSLDDLTIAPVTLTTAQDFKEAPEGTIAEATEHPHDVAVKTKDGWYRTGGMRRIAAAYMPTCRVIRWGNGQ